MGRAWCCGGLETYPICLVPLFFKVDRWRRPGFLTFGILLMIAYSPFLAAGFHILNGTEAFARHWIFNAGAYRVFQNGVPLLISPLTDLKILPEATASFFLKEDRLAKLMVVILFSVFTFYRAKKIKTADELPSESVNVLGALLILSPVVNGWYVLWILPFACITRNKPWLLFSFLVFASYSWWYSEDLAFYLRWVEYIVFFVIFFFWYIQRKQKVALPNKDSL